MKSAFNSKKRVFWEALLITIVIFMMGMLFGVTFENKNISKINEYYAESSTALMDSFAINDLLNSENLDCKIAREQNIKFADKIYKESLKLSEYEESNKITSQIKAAHKKYDMLRTFLWMSNRDLKQRCGNFSYVVYLYNYSTKSASDVAENKAWSRILYDLKQEKRSKIVLIPIAVNNDLISLETLLLEYNLEEFPAVIIDDEYVAKELEDMEEIEKYLD